MDQGRTTFFCLPYEIRTAIYAEAFGKTPSKSRAVLISTRIDSDSLLPLPGTLSPEHRYSCPRSGQILRVCRAIYDEALPILYSQTTFHVISQTFAGKLPSTFTEVGHPFSKHVKHLVWQIDCDLMKHLYSEDLRIASEDLMGLKSLEIRARAEGWRDSFLGEECDREKFVKGREQTIAYAAGLKALMQEGSTENTDLVEDRTFLGRGCVRLQLNRIGYGHRKPRALAANVSPTLTKC